MEISTFFSILNCYKLDLDSLWIVCLHAYLSQTMENHECQINVIPLIFYVFSLYTSLHCKYMSVNYIFLIVTMWRREKNRRDDAAVNLVAYLLKQKCITIIYIFYVIIYSISCEAVRNIAFVL